MLFPGKNVMLLINVTRIGALAVLFYSLSTISNAILQGLGHLNLPLKHSVISLVFHLASLLLLLYGRTGIYGVVVSNILFAIMMCILNQAAIKRHTRCVIDWGKTIGYPILASLIMGIFAFGCYFVIHFLLPEKLGKGRIGSALSLLPAIFVAVVLYFGSLLKMNAFSKEDLDEMPMGGRLKRFIKD